MVTFMVWPEGKTSPSLSIDATRQAFTVAGRITTIVQAVVAP